MKTSETHDDWYDDNETPDVYEAEYKAMCQCFFPTCQLVDPVEAIKGFVRLRQIAIQWDHLDMFESYANKYGEF